MSFQSVITQYQECVTRNEFVHQLLDPAANGSCFFLPQAAARAERDRAAETIRSELKAQTERSARELKSVRAAALRESEHAVEAAVTASVKNRTLELEAVRQKAMAALTQKLEVCFVGLAFWVGFK